MQGTDAARNFPLPQEMRRRRGALPGASQLGDALTGEVHFGHGDLDFLADFDDFVGVGSCLDPYLKVPLPIPGMAHT
jgi:hypothetical protein